MHDADDRRAEAAPRSQRIVFARGAWSVLMPDEPHADSERYQGRALPVLLREEWAIRSTVPSSDGTYFVLQRGAPGADLESPPSSRAAPG